MSINSSLETTSTRILAVDTATQETGYYNESQKLVAAFSANPNAPFVPAPDVDAPTNLFNGIAQWKKRYSGNFPTTIPALGPNETYLIAITQHYRATGDVQPGSLRLFIDVEASVSPINGSQDSQNSMVINTDMPILEDVTSTSLYTGDTLSYFNYVLRLDILDSTKTTYTPITFDELKMDFMVYIINKNIINLTPITIY